MTPQCGSFSALEILKMERVRSHRSWEQGPWCPPPCPLPRSGPSRAGGRGAGGRGREGREVEGGFLRRSWPHPIPSDSQGRMTLIAKVSF